MDEKTKARFWSKVDKCGAEARAGLGPCWLWTAGKDTHGYGQISADRRIRLAHKVSYELHTGPLQRGDFVLHKCDVRACVNPGHLYLGSPLENAADAKARGRFKPAPMGVMHNRARLNPEKVREIRRLADAGLPKAQIARRFGVWPRAIWMILQGKSWKDVA